LWTSNYDEALVRFVWGRYILPLGEKEGKKHLPGRIVGADLLEVVGSTIFAEPQHVSLLSKEQHT